jgi:DNA-binding PadR family transcriptional regulator
MVFWVEIGKASVYQALRRLEEHGLARAPAGRRRQSDRRVFRITAPGQARLRAGLREHRDAAPVRDGCGRRSASCIS